MPVSAMKAGFQIAESSLFRMMKETNIQSQVTSTIVGDDGEAMAKR